MSESSSHENEICDPLRLERCPDCGYLLTGLPEQGVCPECGFAYSADMIVLYGRRRDMTAFGYPRPHWTAQIPFAIAGSLAVFALFVLDSAVLRPGTGASVAFHMLVGPLMVIGVLLYRARRARQDQLSLKTCSQLRLSPQGFAQREFFGPVKLHPWTAELRAKIKIRRWSLYYLLCYLERPWLAGQRRMRIRIRRKGFFHLVPMLADFEFDCQEEVAARVQKVVEGWCKGV